MGCSTSSQSTVLDPTQPCSKPSESNGASSTGVASENGKVAEDTETIPDQTPGEGGDVKCESEPPAAATSAEPPAGNEAQPPADAQAAEAPAEAPAVEPPAAEAPAEAPATGQEAAAVEPEAKDETPAPSE